jgi:heptosyltransferase-2
MTVLTHSNGTVANDSGIMHLSAALGTPTLGIFGSSSPALTSPIGETTDYLYENVECSPCFERTCPLDEDRYKCLRRIKPDTVVDSFLSLLKDSN